MAYVTTEMTKQARVIVNKIGKKYGFKLSVKKSNGTLTITLREGGNLEKYLEIDNYTKTIIEKYGMTPCPFAKYQEWIKELISNLDYSNSLKRYNEYLRVCRVLVEGSTQNFHYKLKGDLDKMFVEMELEVKRVLGYYDNSDASVDYFDTSFYYRVDLGGGSHKPYKVKQKEVV